MYGIRKLLERVNIQKIMVCVSQYCNCYVTYRKHITFMDLQISGRGGDRKTMFDKTPLPKLDKTPLF
jgi:hypothetical protein